MNSTKSTSPDVRAFIPVLRRAANLCRRLNLPTEAALYDQIAVRFLKKPPSWKVARNQMHDAFHDGFTVLPILTKLKDDYRPLTE